MSWPADVPFVGRLAQTATLRAALTDAAAGSGRAVLVEGDPGIGKTRLVAATRETAHARGFTVLVGRAVAADHYRPFGAVADALAPSGELDRLLAGRDGAAWAGENQVYRITEAVCAAVADRCAAAPVLLVLEDLHWADPSTRRCAARLARAAVSLPLLLVLTTRPTARDGDLAGLRAAASEVPLGPLSADEVRTLTDRVLGPAVSPRLRGQLARARGNPLLLLELLATARDGAALPDPETAPFGHLLGALPEAALDLLGTASVLGTAFSVTDLSLLSGRSAAELAAPLRAALAAGALTEQDDRLAFRHELIRDALYATLPRSLRQALHRELVDTMVAAGHPPGRIAEHVVRGAAAGDRAAVRWLRDAATDAGPRAPAVAVELLERATELVDPADPVRGPLSADRALALIWSGRGAEGALACREVLLAGVDKQREWLLRWLLLRSFLVRGRAAEALQEIDWALELGTASVAERARLSSSASLARVMLQELEPAWRLAEQACVLADESGDVLTIAEAVHAKAHVRRSQGRFTEAADLALRAIWVLGDTELMPGPRTLTCTAGTMLVTTDRPAEGYELLAEGRRVNEFLGTVSGIVLHQVQAANVRYLTGDWDEAVADITASGALTEDGEPAWPAMAYGLRALIAVHRDDLAAARADLERVRAARTEGGGPMNEHRTLLARALLAEASGQPAEGLAGLVAAWDRFAARGIGLAYPELGPELVRRLVPAGKHGKAAEVADTVAGCAAHSAGIATLDAAALLCRGLVAADPDLLAGAVAAYRAGPQPLPRALACEDTAAVLVAAGRGDEARDLLTEALHGHQRLGAVRYAARTGAALRSLGVRGRSPATRPGTATGWDALTRTENKVLDLVVQRLSNQEIAQRMFLSRRTVETHVSHILRKVALPSRRALAAEAQRRRTGR